MRRNCEDGVLDNAFPNLEREIKEGIERRSRQVVRLVTPKPTPTPEINIEKWLALPAEERRNY
jgi:hypothetical protein